MKFVKSLLVHLWQFALIASIYYKHLVLLRTEEVVPYLRYLNNLHALVLAINWSVFFILVIFIPILFFSNPEQSEASSSQQDLSKKFMFKPGFFARCLRLLGWAITFGYGVIGAWGFFASTICVKVALLVLHGVAKKVQEDFGDEYEGVEA